MSEVDGAYDELVASLEPSLHEVARRLPVALGLGGAGARWSSYATLAPVVDLPRFAVEGAGEVDDALLTRARTAHLLGGYAGLTLDRLHDGQARARDVPPELRRALGARWAGVLADLSPRPTSARARARRALARLALAATREREAFACGTLAFGAYARLVCAKTAWFGLASSTLLERTAPHRAGAFVAPFRLLMLSLQTLDDAADEAEDRRDRGRSVPELLGVPARALELASARLAADAAEAADAAGFAELGAWLEGRASALRAEARGRGGWAGALDAVAALGLVEAARTAAWGAGPRAP